MKNYLLKFALAFKFVIAQQATPIPSQTIIPTQYSCFNKCLNIPNKKYCNYGSNQGGFCVDQNSQSLSGNGVFCSDQIQEKQLQEWMCPISISNSIEQQNDTSLLSDEQIFMKDVCGYQTNYDYQKMVEQNSSIINIYSKFQNNSSGVTKDLKCKFQLLLENVGMNSSQKQLKLQIKQFQNVKLYIYQIPLSLNLSDIIDSKDQKYGLKYTDKWVIDNGNYNKNQILGGGKRQSTYLILMEICWECKKIKIQNSDYLEIKLEISSQIGEIEEDKKEVQVQKLTLIQKWRNAINARRGNN